MSELAFYSLLECGLAVSACSHFCDGHAQYSNKQWTLL